MAKKKNQEVEATQEQQNIEGGTNMSNENNGVPEGAEQTNGAEAQVANETTNEGNTNPNEEMQNPPLDPNVPNADGTTPATPEKAADREYLNQAGQKVSMSAFIREQFEVLGKSRKEISDAFDIPYRSVYGATMNMNNGAETSGRGRSSTPTMIDLTEAGQVVLVKNVTQTINGEETKVPTTYVDGVALGEGEEVPATVRSMDRNEFIRLQLQEGVERSKIAEKLDVSYGVVYAATKELGSSRAKVLDEVTNEEVTQSELIRRMFARGKTKKEIAAELNVEYNVVWQATKEAKTPEEVREALVVSLEKFRDNISEESLANFDIAVGLLKEVAIKVPETKEEAPAEAGQPATTEEAPVATPEEGAPATEPTADTIPDNFADGATQA